MASVAHAPTGAADLRSGLSEFRPAAGGELFDKCRAFRGLTDELRAHGFFQSAGAHLHGFPELAGGGFDRGDRSGVGGGHQGVPSRRSS